MVEPDLDVAGLLQRIGDRAGLVMTREAVGQHGLVDHALVLLEVRHVRIAEHRETIGPELEAAPNSVQAGRDGLVRQPIDEVEVDPVDAGAMQPIDDGGRLLIALHAIDRALHDRIEALHAQAGAVDAGEPHGLHHLGSQCAGIDLDRYLGRGQHEERMAHRRHQLGKSLRRHDGRRAATEMDVLDLDAATDGLRHLRDLAAQRPLIGCDQPVAANDLGMAAAIPAHLAAERHVQIKRRAGRRRELRQPLGVGALADRRREMRRGRIARIARQTFLAVVRCEISPHVLPIR